MAKRKLSAVSTEDLQRELERRSKSLDALMSRREKLAAQLDELDREIESLGGAAGVTRNGRRGGGGGRGRRTRPRNKMTLLDAMRKVLRNKTLSVTDLAEAVQKAGYQTSSSSFRTIVNQTLIKNPDVFKKVSRGQYTLNEKAA